MVGSNVSKSVIQGDKIGNQDDNTSNTAGASRNTNQSVDRSGEDGFKEVTYKKNKIPDRTGGRRQVAKGSAAKSDVLSAGPTKFTVQLTNINPEKTADDIKLYVKSQNEEIELGDIQDTSSEGWQTKRFLATFDIKHYDEVMNDIFWPERIYYRIWYPERIQRDKQRKPNNGPL